MCVRACLCAHIRLSSASDDFFVFLPIFLDYYVVCIVVWLVLCIVYLFKGGNIAVPVHVLLLALAPVCVHKEYG